MFRLQSLMRRVGMLVACLALAAPTMAKAQRLVGVSAAKPGAAGPGQATFRFADVPWGSTSDALKAALEKQGYTFDKVDEDGDYWFSGKVLGYKTNVIAFMTPKRQLAKITVTLITPDNKARDTYATMYEMLTKKYGEPTASVERFDDPYYDGDGFEDQAIRLGKGHFLALWGPSGDGAYERLGLEITDRLVVRVSYESAGWNAEVDRRRAAQTTAF